MNAADRKHTLTIEVDPRSVADLRAAIARLSRMQFEQEKREFAETIDDEPEASEFYDPTVTEVTPFDNPFAEDTPTNVFDDDGPEEEVDSAAVWESPIPVRDDDDVSDDTDDYDYGADDIAFDANRESGRSRFRD